MPYAIELYLDTESSKTIDEIRNKLISQGINIDQVTKPHISLGIYNEVKIEDFITELQIFSRKIKSLNINLSSIGMFVTQEPVIYLAPTVTKELLDIHAKFHSYFEKYKNQAWDYYLPNNWVPHCTLAMNLDNDMVNRGIEICSKIRLPLKARLDRIGLIKFKPNKQLIEYKLE